MVNTFIGYDILACARTHPRLNAACDRTAYTRVHAIVGAMGLSDNVMQVHVRSRARVYHAACLVVNRAGRSDGVLCAYMTNVRPTHIDARGHV